MVNYIGAYLVSLVLLGLLFQRPSFSKIEQSLRDTPTWGKWLLAAVLLCFAVQEATLPNGVFDFFWPLAVANWVLATLTLWVHEAGHVYWAWGGSVMMSLGGTLNEVCFALLPGAYFFRRSYCNLAFLFFFWLGHNCFGIASYMADARAMKLPLLGGGSHDWNRVFSSWGLLEYDVTLGKAVYLLAVSICIFSFTYFFRCSISSKTSPTE